MEQLRLANNERIVKNYNYSTVTKGVFKKETTQNSLTITNRRIVLQSLSPRSAARKEIPVSAAEYVDATFAKNGRSLAKTIISAILTIALFVAYFTLGEQLGEMVTYILIPAALALVATIINIFVYIFSLGGAVLITIGGRRSEVTLLTLGASNMVEAKGSESMKIKVDREVSATMVNELGAIIMNINDGRAFVEEE